MYNNKTNTSTTLYRKSTGNHNALKRRVSYARLLEMRKFLTTAEIARACGVCTKTASRWLTQARKLEKAGTIVTADCIVNGKTYC